jgi:pilus assembly protein CpaC
LVTRRAETTVELGSGQSFMLAGLIRNNTTNNIDKAPFLGDLPILGALFRSTSFKRQESELVIVVTPYLVRPVSGRLALPSDGYRAPSDAVLNWEGQTYGRQGQAPAPATGPAPAFGGSAGAAAAANPGFKL